MLCCLRTLPPPPPPSNTHTSHLLCNHSARMASWPNRLLALAEMFLRSLDAVRCRDEGKREHQSVQSRPGAMSLISQWPHDCQSVPNRRNYFRNSVLQELTFGCRENRMLLYFCCVRFKLMVIIIPLDQISKALQEVLYHKINELHSLALKAPSTPPEIIKAPPVRLYFLLFTSKTAAEQRITQYTCVHSILIQANFWLRMHW